MRTRRQELASDELKPLVSKIIKENREKYNYSLEDLSRALNHSKNRQTLHKYENGTLNIPYDILFEICRIFNLDTSIFEGYPISKEEQKIIEKKMLKDYVSSLRKDKNLTPQKEKNHIWLSNIFSSIIIQFIASILFSFLAFAITTEIIEIIKIMIIRYAISLIICFVGTIIIYITNSIKER